MSLKFRNNQGIETPVAGLNGTSGELVPSVSLYQSGYLNLVNLTPESSGVTQLDIEHPSVQYRVTFATPFPDANYVVICDSHNTNLQIEVASAGFSANGFIVTVRNLVATMRDDRGETADGFVYTLIDDYFKWQAFKLMTDEVHEADATHIAQNTANFAPAFSEVTSYAVGDYVTYNNILYRCTTAHTAGVWVAGHFTQVTVGENLSSLDTLKTDFASFGKIDTASGYLTDDQLKAINYNVCKTIGYAGSAEIPDSTTILVGFMNFTQGTDQQYQLLFQFNTGKVWTRARYGTWTSWQKLVTAPKVLNTRGTSSLTSLSITSLFPEANTCISVVIDITGDAHAHALFSATLTNFNGVYSMGAVSIGGTANITVSLSTDGVLTATGGNIYNIRVTETKWADHGY